MGYLVIFLCSQIDEVQPCVFLGTLQIKKKGKKVYSDFMLIWIPLELCGDINKRIFQNIYKDQYLK